MMSMARKWKTAKEHSERMWKAAHPKEDYPVKFEHGLGDKLDELEKADRSRQKKGAAYKALGKVGQALGSTKTYKSLKANPDKRSLARPLLEGFGAIAGKVWEADHDRVEELNSRVEELGDVIFKILDIYGRRVFPYENNPAARKAWAPAPGRGISVTEAIKVLRDDVAYIVTPKSRDGAGLHVKADDGSRLRDDMASRYGV